MINDYATLQAAVADELARADLATAIPNFIQLAEADINRSLRTRQMQAIVTATSVGQIITLPTDYREIQALYISFGGVGVEIYPLPPQRLSDVLLTGGPPAGYVVVGNEIRLVGGAGGVDYTLVYFQALPSISTAQNWLILREPGLYLYTSLAHSAPFLKNDERLVTWGTLAKAIRDGMQIEDDSARYGNAPAMQPSIRCAP